MAASDGVAGVAGLDSKMGGNGCGARVALPSVFCRKVDYIAILKIIHGFGFASIRSLVVYRDTSKIDWEWPELLQHSYTYWFPNEHAYHVPKRGLSSLKLDNIAVPVIGRDLETFVAGSLRAWDYIWFCDADEMVHKVYDNVGNEVPSVYVESRMDDIVEDDDYWNLVDTPLSKDADMCWSPCINFVENQSRCCELGISILGKTGALCRLALQLFVHSQAG